MRMRRRRQQHKPGGAIRMIKRERHGERATPGMAGQNRAADAEPAQYLA